LGWEKLGPVEAGKASAGGEEKNGENGREPDSTFARKRKQRGVWTPNRRTGIRKLRELEDIALYRKGEEKGRAGRWGYWLIVKSVRIGGADQRKRG